jgi:ribonuclease HIII
LGIALTKIASTELDELSKRYFQSGGKTRERGQAVILAAFETDLGDPVIGGRALSVLSDAIEREGQLPESVKPHVETFSHRVNDLAGAAHALDRVGDEMASPADLFDYLGDSADTVSFRIDRDEFDKLRRNQPHVVAAARQIIDRVGTANPGEPKILLLSVVAEAFLERCRHYESNGLFASDGIGLVLGVRVVPNDNGEISCFAEAAHDLQNQANLALREALEQLPGVGARWNLEWGTVESEGESIGLSLYVAALIATNRLRPDPLLACTGRLEVGGLVLPVGGIAAKLRAAAQCGICRVLLPEGNREQASKLIADESLPITPLFVARASEVREALTSAVPGREPSFPARVRFARSQIALENVRITDDPREAFHRFRVDNLEAKSHLDLYSTGTVVVPPGPESSALAAVKRAKARIDGPQPEPRQRLKLNIPGDLQMRVREALLEIQGIELAATSEYEAWRVVVSRGKSRVLLIQYAKGTLDIPPGTAPAFDDAVAAVRRACAGLGGLDEAVAKSASNGSQTSTTSEVDESQPYVGTDEAGKGDYFGPLVCAAVFVDQRLGHSLKALGVKDSKLLSDATVRRLAGEIREVAKGRFTITAVPPKAFNELYEQMRSEGKNLNTLLAWAHTRSIENLIVRGLSPSLVISDQFGDPKYIEGKLLANTKGSGVRIVQQPKAERYVAVAAASILARDGFLDWLEKAGKRLGKTVPKGVSPAVIDLAKAIYGRGGEAELGEYAKLSFRTTEQVKGS